MKPERWQQIDKLFQECLELDGEKRATLLSNACAHDSDLKASVEALLAVDEENWDLIESNALESAAPFLADDHPRLAPGDHIAHYEIVGLIGRGGMGEVYVAKDEILNRTVALKFLTLEYTKDKDRLLRFQREAQAASALNHPNILTIHQLGNVDGHQFIATELIEGETLRRRLARSTLTLNETLDLTIQVAGALTAAHRAGIIHRDIKPENIMVRPDGYVKVLDFGVAKLAGHSDQPSGLPPVDTNDLSSGLLMGTLRYMSPEQASGMQVDARSDIFSLGVVLYELIAGQVPFQGRTPAELIESILNDEPRSPATHLPAKVVSIVDKALSKNRETRYQNANEFLGDLRELKQEIDLESKSRTLASPVVPDLRQQTSTASTASIQSLVAVIKKPRTAFAVVLIGVLIVAAILVYRRRKPNGTSLGTWSEKAPMLRPRSGAAVAALEDKLYVASGNSDSGPTNALEVYDPSTDTWSVKAPTPTGRSEAGAAAINGKIYVFGGCRSSDCRVGLTNVVEAFDPRTNTWEQKTPMPTPRSEMASAVIGGKLYVAGGRGPCPPCPAYQSLEVYDPVTDTWDVTKSRLPVAIAGAGGAALDGKFFVAGGEYAGASEPVRSQLLAIYDPGTDKWNTGAPLLTPRAGLGVEAIHGVLYAIGGLNTFEESTVVEAYNPAQNTWSTKAPLPLARMYVQPIAMNGLIYVIGGGGSANRPAATVYAYTAVCPGSTCISTPPGLIGWWPGDGHANDLAGSNKGAMQGNVIFETGKVGMAFNFDGSSFVTMRNPPALNLRGNQVTLSGWIKPRTNGPAIYFGKTQFGFNDYLLMCGRGMDGMIRANDFEITVLGYSDFPANTKLFIPPTGQWTHIAMTYDGAMITLYANGDIVGQTAHSGNIGGNDVPFNIGGRINDEGTGKFNGLIDEVQVFNRALSRAEIQAISEAGANGQCKPQATCR